MTAKTSPKQSKTKRTKVSAQQDGARTQEVLMVAVAIFYAVVFVVCCVQFYISPSNRSLKQVLSIPQQQQSSMDHHTNAATTTTGNRLESNVDIIDESASSRDNNNIDNNRKRVAVRYDQINGVNYYQCESTQNANVSSGGSDLVILDGSSYFSRALFTDETATIGLDPKHSEKTFCELCHQGFAIGLSSVIALDVEEDVASSKLLTVLRMLRNMGKIQSLPLAAIVTPMNSATSIVDWISYGDIQSLQHELALNWISVSSHIAEDDVDDLEIVSGWPILALYGDQDEAGENTARMLAARVGAESQSLPGTRTFHLDHSREFASAIMTYLGDRLVNTTTTRKPLSVASE